ncbi:MAG: ribosomal protein methyltransferase [Actinomycetota bacterium]|jgi:ribosomal protein L11 methyltransferase
MTRGLRIDTTPSDVEVVSDRLWAFGATAISEEWRNDGTVILRTALGEDRDLVASLLKRELPDAVWIEEEIDLSVADTWKDHVSVVEATDRLWVRPAWIGTATTSVPSGVSVISIDPGPTFGLGDHPTTRGSLQLLSDVVADDSTILDVGCGSGVLGIAALVLGARRAVGTDITPAAIETSLNNAEVNGVADRWSVTLEPLEVFGEPFDVVVANILAPTLIELSEQLRRLAGRHLIVSGVLNGHDAHVHQALEPFVEVHRVVIDGWASSLLMRPGSLTRPD